MPHAPAGSSAVAPPPPVATVDAELRPPPAAQSPLTVPFSAPPLPPRSVAMAREEGPVPPVTISWRSRSTISAPGSAPPHAPTRDSAGEATAVPASATTVSLSSGAANEAEAAEQLRLRRASYAQMCREAELTAISAAQAAELALQSAREIAAAARVAPAFDSLDAEEAENDEAERADTAMSPDGGVAAALSAAKEKSSSRDRGSRRQRSGGGGGGGFFPLFSRKRAPTNAALEDRLAEAEARAETAEAEAKALEAKQASLSARNRTLADRLAQRKVQIERLEVMTGPGGERSAKDAELLLQHKLNALDAARLHLETELRRLVATAEFAAAAEVAAATTGRATPNAAPQGAMAPDSAKCSTTASRCPSAGSMASVPSSHRPSSGLFEPPSPEPTSPLFTPNSLRRLHDGMPDPGPDAASTPPPVRAMQPSAPTDADAPPEPPARSQHRRDTAPSSLALAESPDKGMHADVYLAQQMHVVQALCNELEEAAPTSLEPPSTPPIRPRPMPPTPSPARPLPNEIADAATPSIRRDASAGSSSAAYLAEPILQRALSGAGSARSARSERQPDTPAEARLKGIGVLKVLVVSGRDIAPSEPDGAADSYVKVIAAGVEKRTKVRKRTLHPEWLEVVEFEGQLANFVRHGLELHVTGFDEQMPDEPRGSIAVSLDRLRDLDKLGFEEGLSTNGSLCFTATWVQKATGFFVDFDSGCADDGSPLPSPRSPRVRVTTMREVD